MAKRRAKKPAAAAHLAATTEAGTTSAAAASTSHDVEMPPTTSDSSNSPALQGSESSDEARVTKHRAESTRPRAEPGLREILRLTANFSAFEKPPTGTRRRCATRDETTPERQPISRASAHSSSETSAAGRSPSPAPSTSSLSSLSSLSSVSSLSSLSSLSSSDPESEHEEDASAFGEYDEAISGICARRDMVPPRPATGDSVAPADLATTAKSPLPDDHSHEPAQAPSTDQSASSSASVERSRGGQAKSNKRRREPKRVPSEVAKLQRDYFAASTDDLQVTLKKRTRRDKARQPTEPSPSAIKTKRRRAASRDPEAPPSELRWLKSDYFSAAQQPVQGKRRSHSRKEVETARRIETVRAAKRAHMAKRDAGDANSPPPPPPPPKKRRRTAVSPELVGPEEDSRPGPSGVGEEAAQQRDISPELYAPSSANPAPLVSPVPQPVVVTESPQTNSPDGDPLIVAPGVDASPATTERSSLPKKRERKRPARYADAIDTLDTGSSANNSAVSATTLTRQPVVRENKVQSSSQAPGGPLEDGRIPDKPTAPKRGRLPKAVAQVIHPTDPTAGTALPENVIADRSGPSIPSPDASPLVAVEVQAETTKSSSKPKQPAPTSAAPRHKKREKPRTRHSAFDSRETWVKPERNLKLRENGRPPIWCEGRQELCETLDYFKSYQGGHCAHETRSPTARSDRG